MVLGLVGHMWAGFMSVTRGMSMKGMRCSQPALAYAPAHQATGDQDGEDIIDAETGKEEGGTASMGP